MTSPTPPLSPFLRDLSDQEIERDLRMLRLYDCNYAASRYERELKRRKAEPATAEKEHSSTTV